VIVLGAHDGLMPHRLTDDVEEERRVFHVALTRCREQVVLLADEDAETPFIDDLTREPEPYDEAAEPAAETRLERSRRSAPRGSFTPSGPTDEALRAWRLERSRADGVPAYVVLSNATVAEIAAAQPRNPIELSRVSGIGPTKLERYGEDILRIVGAQREPTGGEA
jgi:DNA helicase-2/ATP-dependent DNA helicase PcrA